MQIWRGANISITGQLARARWMRWGRALSMCTIMSTCTQCGQLKKRFANIWKNTLKVQKLQKYIANTTVQMLQCNIHAFWWFWSERERKANYLLQFNPAGALTNATVHFAFCILMVLVGEEKAQPLICCILITPEHPPPSPNTGVLKWMCPPVTTKKHPKLHVYTSQMVTIADGGAVKSWQLLTKGDWGLKFVFINVRGAKVTG